jgi:hypothetical protein
LYVWQNIPFALMMAGPPLLAGVVALASIVDPENWTTG